MGLCVLVLLAILRKVEEAERKVVEMEKGQGFVW